MRRSAAVLLMAAIASLGLAAGRAAGEAPPGATALCKDGTYSYSQTPSGTCSHHGGVSAWLDGSGATNADGKGGGVSTVGATVLLAPRSASIGCTRGARPDRRCSPGAYYAGLKTRVICASSFRTGSIRNVPQFEKYAVEREYGMRAALYGRSIEIDHIVSLELGGSNDIANLFPEPGTGAASYHAKDKLENRLHVMVCGGQITLRQAQTQIASNWEALYQREYGVFPRR
jgi:Protein of unknown function (DUF3761)